MRLVRVSIASSSASISGRNPDRRHGAQEEQSQSLLRQRVSQDSNPDRRHGAQEEVSIASSSASISGHGQDGRILPHPVGVSIASSSASISGQESRGGVEGRREICLNRFFVSEYLRTSPCATGDRLQWAVSIASSSASISGHWVNYFDPNDLTKESQSLLRQRVSQDETEQLRSAGRS